MAGIATLGIRTSIAMLFDTYLFTRGRLERHRLTSGLVAELDVLRPELDDAQREELELMAALHAVNAGAEFADDDLDGIADKITSAILVESRGNRNTPLYMRYYGTQRPSELKRPILGGQLETMRTWPPSLKESHNPDLQQVGADLEAQVSAADAVQDEMTGVRQRLTDFRMVGTRARLIERFNAVRKDLFGKLSKIQHDQPQLGSDWAESFFRASSTSDRMSVRGLERRIASAEAQLASLRAQRDELIAREEQIEAARLQAARAAKEAALEAARQAAAELAERVAELEADLGDDPPAAGS